MCKYTISIKNDTIEGSLKCGEIKLSEIEEKILKKVWNE